MKCNKFGWAVAIVASSFMGFVGSVQAADVYWDGGGANNLWTTAENWVDDIVPTVDDYAWFDDQGTGIVDITGAVKPNRFYLQGAADGYDFIGTGDALNTQHELNFSGTATFSSDVFPINNLAIRGSGTTKIGARFERTDTMYFGYSDGATLDVLDGGVVDFNRLRMQGGEATINVQVGGLVSIDNWLHLDTNTPDIVNIYGTVAADPNDAGGDGKVTFGANGGNRVVIHDGGLLAGNVDSTSDNDSTVDMWTSNATLAIKGGSADVDTLAEFYDLTSGSQGLDGDNFRLGADDSWTLFDDMVGSNWYALTYEDDYMATGNGFTVLTTVEPAQLTWKVGNGNWNTSANWEGGPPSLPDSTANALLNNGATITVANPGQTVASLMIENGAVAVAAAAELSTDGKISVAASGALSVADLGTLDAFMVETAGTTTLGAGAAVDVLNVTGGVTAVNGAAIDAMHVGGGAATVTGSVIPAVSVTGGSLDTGADTGTLTVDGGAVVATAAISASSLDVASGSLTLSGGLSADNAVISGGTVDLQGNALTVNAGGSARLHLVTFDNPTDSFTLTGANLGDAGIGRTATISGGTTTISGLNGYVLLHDDFDNNDLATGGGNATNGGFNKHGGFPSGVNDVTESGGVATVFWNEEVTNSGGADTFEMIGMDSISAADVDGQAAPVRATWKIDSMSFPTDGGDGNKLDHFKVALGDLIFTIVSQDTDTQTYSMGLGFQDRSVYPGGFLVGNTGFTRTEVEDGFEVVMDVDATGWKLSLPGTTIDDQSGTWADAGTTYADVFATTTWRAGDGGAGLIGVPDAHVLFQGMRRKANPFSAVLDSVRVATTVPDLMGINTNIAVTENSTLDVDPSTVTAELGDLTVADGVTELNLGSAVYVFNDASLAADMSLNGELTVGSTLDLGDGVGTTTIGSGELVLMPNSVTNVQLSAAGQVGNADTVVLLGGDSGLMLDGQLNVSSMMDRDANDSWSDDPVTIIDNPTDDGSVGWLDNEVEPKMMRNNRFETVVPADGTHLGQGVFLRGVDYVNLVGNITSSVDLDVLVALGGDADGDGKVWLSDWAA
ncbi:MAG: hypothetical protein HQ567_00055, partial [Candidatus Nealsonbacteria bacterium]|nr:hypothetical protein [Candidatus Nealsonbacteria bacterium]